MMTITLYAFTAWIISLGFTLTITKDAVLRDVKEGLILATIINVVAVSLIWPILCIISLCNKRGE